MAASRANASIANLLDNLPQRLEVHPLGVVGAKGDPCPRPTTWAASDCGTRAFSRHLMALLRKPWKSTMSRPLSSLRITCSPLRYAPKAVDEYQLRLPSGPPGFSAGNSHSPSIRWAYFSSPQLDQR
jgi:hypothetical protein